MSALCWDNDTVSEIFCLDLISITKVTQLKLTFFIDLGGIIHAVSIWHKSSMVL